MTRKYSRGELGEFLAGLQQHPEDGRIVYTPEDREKVIPLLKEGVIKAAIMAAQDSQAFAALTREAQEHEVRDYDAGTIAQQFFVRDGGYYLYEDREKLSQEDWAEFPVVVREAFDRLSNFIYPHESWNPWRPLRQAANRASSFLWNWRPGEQYEEAIVRTAEALDHFFPKRQTNLMVFWQKAGPAQTSLIHNLHYDHGLTAHISGHNPMEFLVGELTPDQWEILKKNRVEKQDMLLTHYPQLKDRVRRLDPGDMVVFSSRFVHRSPAEAEHGQLNFAAEPDDRWPYDLS